MILLNNLEKTVMTCKTPGTLYNMESHDNVITYTIILPKGRIVKETAVKSLERIFHDEAERILDYVTSDNEIALKARILDTWLSVLDYWLSFGMLVYWLIGLSIIYNYSFICLNYLLISMMIITSIIVIGSCITKISYDRAKGK